MNEEVIEQEVNSKRPKLLSILCILSFISSGLMGIVLILVIWLLGSSVADQETLMTMLAALGVWFIGLLSIILLWKQRKIGFYLYLISNVVVTSLQIYSTGEVSWLTITLPLIFILAFASQFKALK